MITQKELKEMFNYDPETGLLTRLTSPANNVKIGAVAGSLSHGYLQIDIQGKSYRAHRIAWCITFGYWPKEIDHINHVRDDNRLVNLREVTRPENSRNRPLQSNNTSGAVGVYWHRPRNKWVARIKNNGKTEHLGYFIKYDDAVAARKAAEIKYDFHKNHGDKKMKEEERLSEYQAERLEEARIADLEYLEECKEDRTDYQQGMYDSGMKEGDFL